MILVGIAALLSAAPLSAQARARQVTIETVIIQTRLDDLEELGFDWGVQLGGFDIASRDARIQTTIGKTFPDQDNFSIWNFDAELQLDLLIAEGDEPSTFDPNVSMAPGVAIPTASEPGIQVEVIPSVTPYGTILLDIQSSSFDSPGSESNRNTDLNFGAGVGGRLLLNRGDDDAAKRPILADIALLAKFFEHQTVPALKVGVIVYLSPRIIRQPE